MSQSANNGKHALSRNGMVATAFPKATEAGVEILRIGGNAVDAACASALTLGVCEPQASGLGGQTMMLISFGKKVIAIDGSSRAPSLAHANAIYKNDRNVGYRATTVPSTLSTLYYVQQRYGNLSWEKILQPAIMIARLGYRITDLQHRLQKREKKNFERVESGSGSQYFLKNNQPYQVNDVFCQPDLARLLKLIAEEGIDIFYKGNIAKKIDADMREHGGLLRFDDLALIPWPIERRPLRRRFRKYRVFSMPPPGAGRTLLFSLMMVDAIPAGLLKNDEFKHVHMLASVFRKALRERSDRPFDPEFYPQVSEKEMLSRSFAQQCIKAIMRKVDESILSSLITSDEMTGETTHLSVIDKNNLAVSLTQSIERVYGSKAAAAGLGFLYNNYLSDFEYEMPDHPFYLRPNAVPWATVAPTLIFRGEDIWMSLGSPGSERIFSSITQFLLHVIDDNMNLYQAMLAPRLHCSMGGRVSLEADRFSPELIQYLNEKGYRIDKREGFSFYLGAVQAVMKLADNKGFEGVAEVRRDGTAGGL
jgi:gamma-glutamyltranspeptidase/glutathione hydrolase